MKNARRLPLIIGIALALGTGVLLLNYLGSLNASAATAPTRRVLVAAHDIPARALLGRTLVVEEERVVRDVDNDALVKRDDVIGKYSLITIPAGSVVTKSKIGLAGANALPARLPVGMRAVSISIDRVKGVAGLIQPGDRVDVIAVPPRVGSEVPQASAILRGALVVAMGNAVETVSATPGPDSANLTTVTLALTPKEVDLLAAADLNTTLRLALRPPKESIRAFPSEPLVLGVANQSAPAQNAAPAASAPVAAPPVAPVPAAVANGVPPARAVRTIHSGVVVIDGDRYVEAGAGSSQQ